ncbi:DUF2171 domain-containing protein [Hyalangium versicolor]|uniref:DUF2171 domain-containing protein n=1 Tax=Hyalangium versicolor TaxID=2861190 RepID=UPI001CCEC440|nr:DUF2171 domain-containing protein [Hyalangium versicolor]
MVQRTNIRKGMAVMSSDGVQMGRVVDVTADSIIIEKGQLFLRDFSVPLEDIHSVRGDEIVLSKGHATLRQINSKPREGTAHGTVGIAGVAAPTPQGLGLGPSDLTQARMDSAKFQDHERYDLRPTGDSVPRATEMESSAERKRPRESEMETPYVPLPHEPPLAERRAAGPGWDPLSVDEEQEEQPRTSGPDAKPPTRY